MRIAEAWNSPEQNRVLLQVYPELEKTSIDFAVMEPASRDTAVQVAALPMELEWLDVGSWPSFGKTIPVDECGNRVFGDSILVRDCSNTLAISRNSGHMVALLGCSDLIVIQTPDATLVCSASSAENVKKFHAEVGKIATDKFS